MDWGANPTNQLKFDHLNNGMGKPWMTSEPDPTREKKLNIEQTIIWKANQRNEHSRSQSHTHTCPYTFRWRTKEHERGTSRKRGITNHCMLERTNNMNYLYNKKNKLFIFTANEFSINKLEQCRKCRIDKSLFFLHIFVLIVENISSA